MSVENGGNGNGVAGNSDPVGSTAPDSGYQPAPGEFVIDPASVGTGNGNPAGGNSGDGNPAPGKRKRGRPPGSGTRATAQKAAAPLDVDGITAILLSSHAMLATLIRVPELQLDPKEAADLSKGVVNVARHYDVQATQKTIDWTNLIFVLAMIYGTRMVAIGNRRKEARRAAQEAKSPGPILDFTKAKDTQAGLQ